MNFPEDIEISKGKVAKALVPIYTAVDNGIKAGKNYLFKAQRTGAGRKLLAYYPYYFIFINLLGFKYHGQLEGYAGISGAVVWITG